MLPVAKEDLEESKGLEDDGLSYSKSELVRYVQPEEDDACDSHEYDEDIDDCWYGRAMLGKRPMRPLTNKELQAFLGAAYGEEDVDNVKSATPCSPSNDPRGL